MANLTNLTTETVQDYQAELHKQYSDSSFNRKLSSLRRFFQFLKEKGKINGQRAKKLTDILNAKSPIDIEIVAPTEILPAQKKWEMRDGKGGAEDTHHASHIIRRKSHMTFLTIVFLFFSLNIYLVSKINANLLKQIDAAMTKPIPTDETIPDITLTLAIDATLTDNFSIPLSYEQDISFAIYPSQTSATRLYTTGLCQIKPNDSGRIFVGLGEDCGRPIPYLLFTQYPELFLGISIGFGSELQPRLPLKKLELLSAPPTPTLLPLMNVPTPRLFPLFVDENLATESATIATDSSLIN